MFEYAVDRHRHPQLPHGFQSRERNWNRPDFRTEGRWESESHGSPRISEGAAVNPCLDRSVHLLALGQDKGSAQGVPHGRDV
jgi:hypothetical protein